MIDSRDLTLMRLNLYGLRTAEHGGRARLHVTLKDDPERLAWRLILATGQPTSPFELREGLLLDLGEPIATAAEVEHDDAKLGYFRNGLHSLTLNTNRRSLCTGCVFCPNTGLESSDPLLNDLESYLSAWIEATLSDHHLDSLGDVQDVTLSTGCFGDEDRALSHLRVVQNVLEAYGFDGRLGILSSVIRSRSALARFAEIAGKAALILTLECVSRRDLILKQTKADLTVDEALKVLEDARGVGVDTGVTLVVGLDPLPLVEDWLRRAASFLTVFPNLQIFQAHGRFMQSFRTPGADGHQFFVDARRASERVLQSQPMLPAHWANYRPLWYYEYAGAPLR